jgi:hypothetical protein
MDEVGASSITLQDFQVANFSLTSKHHSDVLKYSDMLTLSDEQISTLVQVVDSLPDLSMKVVNNADNSFDEFRGNGNSSKSTKISIRRHGLL